MNEWMDGWMNGWMKGGWNPKSMKGISVKARGTVLYPCHGNKIDTWEIHHENDQNSTIGPFNEWMNGLMNEWMNGWVSKWLNK